MSDKKGSEVILPAFGRQGGGGGRFLSEKVRPKDGRKTVARLVGLFRPRLGSLSLVFVCVAVGAACALTAPWLIGKAIDAAAGQFPLGLWVLVPVLCGVYFVDALVSWSQTRVMTRVSQGLVLDLRQSLFNSLVRQPLTTFDTRDHGDLMSRMSNDIDNVAQGIAQSGTQLAGAVLGVGGALVLMLILSPLLTLAALVTVPLIFLLTGVVSKKTRGYFREQQAALGALNAHLDETVNGFLEVKTFDREAAAVDRFDDLNKTLKTAGTRAQVWAGLVMPLMNVINNFGFAVLAGVGGILTLQGMATVGLIASFVGYSRQFGRPLNDIANTWNTLQLAIAGAERVFEILDGAPERDDGPDAQVLAVPQGAIRFEAVTFGYQLDRPVLKNFTLEVNPGETVALVGPTGSGKTTVVNLLLRFYDPDSGRIILDGLPLERWTRSSLRRAFGVVLQDTWLFEGTVADNIRYGRPDASDEEVATAARAANADGFVSRLPGGYSHNLLPGGTNLSQGQRQLLAVARAVLADAPLLILDEATSSIDTRTEFHIQEAMIQLMKGRTCFIIAHRLSTIRDADRIVLIDGGEVVEAGTHDELLALGSRYAAMYRASARPPTAGISSGAGRSVSGFQTS